MFFFAIQEDNWLIYLGQQGYLQQCDGALLLRAGKQGGGKQIPLV